MGTKSPITLVVIVCVLIGIGLVGLLWWSLPKVSSPGTIVGFVIGGFIGVITVLVNVAVGMWNRSRDVEEERKGRNMRAALDLTKMDARLRQEAARTSGDSVWLLAPLKAYRTIYKALEEFHTTGKWPDKPLKEGLLNIYRVGNRGDDTKDKEQQ